MNTFFKNMHSFDVVQFTFSVLKIITKKMTSQNE